MPMRQARAPCPPMSCWTGNAQQWVSLCSLADSGFFKNFLYQGGVKSTVSWVFEALILKFQKATTKIGVFLTLPS